MSYIDFGLAYLHLTLAHAKGRQGHAYLHLTLAHAKGRQGHAHLHLTLAHVRVVTVMHISTPNILKTVNDSTNITISIK